MNKIIEILEKVGLTSQESRIYLALLELSESQTGNLCKYTNIASSNIYKLLDSLMQKGLVNYRLQNNIKIFMPANPETLNELFLKKQKKLEEERIEINNIITHLKKRKTETEPFSNYKYFEGISGIKSMWYEINDEMTNDYTIKIYTAKKESYQRFVGFYDEHHKIRQKKKIKEQLIFPKEDEELAKKRINQLTQIRFKDLKNQCEWGIIGNKLFMQYITGKTPRGFIIEDEKFAKTFEQTFNQIWDEI